MPSHRSGIGRENARTRKAFETAARVQCFVCVCVSVLRPAFSSPANCNSTPSSMHVEHIPLRGAGHVRGKYDGGVGRREGGVGYGSEKNVARNRAVKWHKHHTQRDSDGPGGGSGKPPLTW